MNRLARSAQASLLVALASGLWVGCSATPTSEAILPSSNGGASGSNAMGAQAGAVSAGAPGAGGALGTGGAASGGAVAAGGTLGSGGASGMSSGGIVSAGGAGTGAGGAVAVAGAGAGGSNAAGRGSGGSAAGALGIAGAANGGGGAGGATSTNTAGAKSSGGATNCNLPASVSFQKDVQPFLITSCGGGNGCHVIDASSTMSSGGFNHAYDWATAGAHASSCPGPPVPMRFQVLIATINGANPTTCTKSRKMPPPDATGAGLRTPLTACQIAALQAWLDEPLVTQTHRADDSSPTTPYPMPPFN